MKKERNQKGFISIIGLMIFALLTIVGLIVQRTSLDTINNIKATNNYYAAQDIADSAMEALQFDLKNREAGYSNTINCEYGEGAVTNPSECTDKNSAFSHLANLAANKKNVEISMEVKGRSTDAEKVKGPCTGSGFFTDCYIVPSPGTGNAGEMCKLYSPAYYPELGVLDSNLANGDTNLHQIDYSCNWNKLQFGSSATDRAVIPLYYDDGSVDLVNPFQDGGKIFALRMRTPCKPCVYGNDTPGDDERYCEKGADRTVCSETERYVLDETDGNDILVQWQIMGQCDGGAEECGLVPYVKYLTNGGEVNEFSGISERNLNGENFAFLYDIVLHGYRQGVDTNNYIISSIGTKLQSMEKPKLTMFLTGKLISENGGYIPYLEYQLLTNSPMANSIAEITATVNVDGNSFDRTIYKSEESALIDFAIQN